MTSVTERTREQEPDGADRAAAAVLEIVKGYHAAGLDPTQAVAATIRARMRVAFEDGRDEARAEGRAEGLAEAERMVQYTHDHHHYRRDAARGNLSTWDTCRKSPCVDFVRALAERDPAATAPTAE